MKLTTYSLAALVALATLPSGCLGDETGECQLNETLLSSGESAETDDCNTCTCEDGELTCTTAGCDGITPDDTPNDASCELDGQVYAHGQTNIPAPDGCNQCVCDDGQLACTERACLPTDECGGLLGLSCEENEYCHYDPGDLCGAADALGECRPRLEDAICTAEYEPVCGCDGETYSNACEAAGAAVGILDNGPCEQTSSGKSCLGGDGQLYPDGAGNVPDTQSCNTCSCVDGVLATCTEIFCPVDPDEPDSTACGGILGLACEENEFCHYQPGDLCGAADAPGECRPRLEDATCTAEYDPVCGCDGTTYSNSCTAAGAAVGILHLGECE